ncbi:MAG: hypothetical protein K2O12_01240, partial [Muribaculaceae bacterium]|nr:hypothetical protein [Muribaculaceae bacterium]
MRSKAFLAALTIATALAIPSTKAADNALELTFSRNGTTASSVTVNTSGVDGATATLVSASHSFRGTSGSTTSSIICPNVNGNTSPTITLEFSITGLAESFSITSIDFNIHALNGSDGYQDHNDNKKRLYNLSAHINGSPFGSLTEFDIADGVNPTGTTRNKLWNIQPATSLSATNPLTLRLTISAGSANEGCFFGLSSIRFNTGSEPPGPDPDPDPTPQGDYYLIKWKANTSDYMQQSGDKFIVGDYSVSTSCFWELI